MAFIILGATLVSGGKNPTGRLTISGGEFQGPGAKVSGPVYQLPESAVFPGLFNAYDGLLGSVAPRFGRGPYGDRESWHRELVKSRVWENLQKIKPQDRILLGYYRQILSGVTTVFDPGWKSMAHLAPPWKPIRVVERYSYLNRVISAPNRKGDELEEAQSLARKDGVPLIVRCDEGSGTGATGDLGILEGRGYVSPNLVVLHGNGAPSRAIQQAAHGKASWIWSPSSEKFLYDKTAELGVLLKSGSLVALGSDAPVAGGQLIFDELRAAKEALLEQKIRIEDQDLTAMVTHAPAKIFGTTPKNGFLAPGSPADFTVIRKRRHPDAHAALLAARCHDLELVVCGGKPLLARDAFREAVKESGEPGQMVDLFGEAVWLAGKPLDLKKRVEAALGESCAWRFFPIG